MFRLRRAVAALFRSVDGPSTSRAFAAAVEPVAPSGGRGWTKQGGVKKAGRKGKDGADGMSPKLQQIVEALAPQLQASKLIANPSTRQRIQQFFRMKEMRANDLERGMLIRLKLQRAALRALPPELRAKVQPDYSDAPLNRMVLMDTPPEAYRDPPGEKP